MSTWHNQDFATRDNGLAGLDAKLIFNTHLMVRHVSMLSSWARAGYFTYSGRRIEGERRFERGECAMITAASASYAAAAQRGEIRFRRRAAAVLRRHQGRAAPFADQRRRRCGRWPARTHAEYRGMARFLAWLARPEVQAEWHQRTGYVPVTRAAYELTAQVRLLQGEPGPRDRDQAAAAQPADARIARHPARRVRSDPRDHRGGTGRRSGRARWRPSCALDRAAERGDVLLRKFEREHRAGAEPAMPGARADARRSRRRRRNKSQILHLGLAILAHGPTRDRIQEEIQCKSRHWLLRWRASGLLQHERAGADRNPVVAFDGRRARRGAERTGRTSSTPARRTTRSCRCSRAPTPSR